MKYVSAYTLKGDTKRKIKIEEDMTFQEELKS